LGVFWIQVGKRILNTLFNITVTSIDRRLVVVEEIIDCKDGMGENLALG
jgi:hypothetical protein